MVGVGVEAVWPLPASGQRNAKHKSNAFVPFRLQFPLFLCRRPYLFQPFLWPLAPLGLVWEQLVVAQGRVA